MQQRLVEHLDAKNVTPNRVFTSPLLRAVQSARVVADHWGVPVIEEPALGESFDAEKVITLGRQALQSGDTLFFVGHEPTLAQLANTLCGEELLPAGLSKSGAVVMVFDGDVGEGAAHDCTVLHPDQYV